MISSRKPKSNLLSLTVHPEQIKSLRDIAIETLRDAIVSGQLQPGEHLKERELSQAMNISTTPIKEALRVLGHEGLVETIPRKGTFVSQFVNSSIQEILMLKASVEGLSARLAAQKCTDMELLVLQDQIELMEGLVKSRDTEQLMIENTKFHNLIRESARNPMIYQILATISSIDQAFRKRALRINEEIEVGFSEHRGIYESIRLRDPDEAERKMKAHIMRTLNHVLNP